MYVKLGYENRGWRGKDLWNEVSSWSMARDFEIAGDRLFARFGSICYTLGETWTTRYIRMLLRLIVPTLCVTKVSNVLTHNMLVLTNIKHQ